MAVKKGAKEKIVDVYYILGSLQNREIVGEATLKFLFISTLRCVNIYNQKLQSFSCPTGIELLKLRQIIFRTGCRWRNKAKNYRLTASRRKRFQPSIFAAMRKIWSLDRREQPRFGCNWQNLWC